VVAGCQGRVGITKQPLDLCPHIAGANTRIMTAIEQAMRTVALGIVKLSARLAVATARLEFASKQAGRPGGVMGLQAQAVVPLVRSQGQQLMRKSAAEKDVTAPRTALPHTVDSHEVPARFSMPPRQLVRPGVGGDWRRRVEPFGRIE